MCYAYRGCYVCYGCYGCYGCWSAVQRMWLGVQTPARAEGPVHRRTALRLARAAGHTAPVVQTVLQRFSLAGRGAGRQLEPRLAGLHSQCCLLHIATCGTRTEPLPPRLLPLMGLHRPHSIGHSAAQPDSGHFLSQEVSLRI